MVYIEKTWGENWSTENNLVVRIPIRVCLTNEGLRFFYLIVLSGEIEICKCFRKFFWSKLRYRNFDIGIFWLWIELDFDCEPMDPYQTLPVIFNI